MIVVNMYSKKVKGKLIITGNTLGLSKLSSSLLPGNLSSIGNFITTDISITTPAGWASSSIQNFSNSENITSNWQDNSSAALLNIPHGSTVDAAYLFWIGVKENNASIPPLSVASNINDSISLKTPNGATISVTPKVEYNKDDISQYGDVFYERCQDITDIVSNNGSGEYTIGKVPSAIFPLNDNNNFAGWFIIVSILNPLERYRTLNIYTLGGEVRPSNPQNINILGLETPQQGDVGARLLVVAAAAHTEMGGSTVLAGQSISSPSIVISGPNNKASGFFASQINNNDGLLDVTGTFGSRNQNATLGTNTFAARQGLDLTNVSMANAFTNNQNTAGILFDSNSDNYVVMAAGVQIDNNEPYIKDFIKTASKEYAMVNDFIDYTIAFKNEGYILAEHVIFIDTIPDGLSYVQNSFKVNGVTIPSPNTPQTGYNLGSIANGNRYTINFRVQVTTIPSPNPIINRAYLGYDFISSLDNSRVYASLLSNPMVTTIPMPDVRLKKSVNEIYIVSPGELEYTFELKNIGNSSAATMTLLDTIPSGTTFIPGSLIVNKVQSNENITTGVSINTSLAIDETMTVSFRVNVETLPCVVLRNKGTVYYTTGSGPRFSDSNVVVTTISMANLVIRKTLDKYYVKCTDLLTSNIVLTNTGNLDAINVVVVETIPEGTTFIENSVRENGVLRQMENPLGGILLATIPQGTTTTLSFILRINCTI